MKVDCPLLLPRPKGEPLPLETRGTLAIAVGPTMRKSKISIGGTRPEGDREDRASGKENETRYVLTPLSPALCAALSASPCALLPRPSQTVPSQRDTSHGKWNTASYIGHGSQDSEQSWARVEPSL